MPQLANPFSLPGQWYRGTLHLHTTNSDGFMPPERLIQHYQYAGWDFLALTDHWKVTEVPSAPAYADMTIIPGTEVDSGAGSSEIGTSYHIVGLDMKEVIPRQSGLKGTAAAQWYVDAIREQGGEAVIAHPYWSGLTLRDVEGVRRHMAIEAYNADTEVHIGRGNSTVLWDDLLSHGIPTLGLGVDDCHRPGYDSVRGWTVVRAPDRSVPSLMGALRAGHFYASSGPEIYDVQWEPGQPDADGHPGPSVVRVRCSAARSITAVADGTKGARLNAGPFGAALRSRRLRGETGRPEGVYEGELLNGAELLLTGRERYVRIQVEDVHGRCAWTNPLFVRTPEERAAPTA